MIKKTIIDVSKKQWGKVVFDCLIIGVLLAIFFLLKLLKQEVILICYSSIVGISVSFLLIREAFKAKRSFIEKTGLYTTSIILFAELFLMIYKFLIS